VELIRSAARGRVDRQAGAVVAGVAAAAFALAA
jgi:hypothetical protein